MGLVIPKGLVCTSSIKWSHQFPCWLPTSTTSCSIPWRVLFKAFFLATWISSLHLTYHDLESLQFSAVLKQDKIHKLSRSKLISLPFPKTLQWHKSISKREWYEQNNCPSARHTFSSKYYYYWSFCLTYKRKFASEANITHSWGCRRSLNMVVFLFPWVWDGGPGLFLPC